MDQRQQHYTILLVPPHLEVSRLLALPVCFDGAHVHIFEAILTGELTSSNWVSLSELITSRYHLGVELERVPRCQLLFKRCCKGSRFLRGLLTNHLLVSPVSLGVALLLWPYRW